MEGVNKKEELQEKMNNISLKEKENQPQEVESIEEEDFAAHFKGLKRKTKKKQPTTTSATVTKSDTMHSDEESSSSNIDGSKISEKKRDMENLKDSISSSMTSQNQLSISNGNGISSFELARDKEYASMLTRIFNILRLQNPDLAGERKKYTIVPPSIHREGTKKTSFGNVVEIAKRMNRAPDHVIQFLFTELGTTGSVDGNQRLIIKGKFQQKQIENVLKKYIGEYVTCKTCKSPNTILRRENRLFFQQCESCGSTRTVSSIKTGFKAQTEKRAALRNKEP